MNLSDLGLIDEISIHNNHEILIHPTYREKIRKIFGLILIICIILFILSSIFIYIFIKKQELSSKINENMKLRNETKEMFNRPKIKVGTKFGDITGYDFDDSLIEKFTFSYYIRGIQFRPTLTPLHWFQCFYSTFDNPDHMIKGDLHGIREDSDDIAEFFLEKDEKISKIQLKIDTIQLFDHGTPSLRTQLIMAMRFYTTKGRISPTIDHINGQIYSEEFDGYYLGYVSG